MNPESSQLPLRPDYYFRASEGPLRRLFEGVTFVWEPLDRLAEFVEYVGGGRRRIDGQVSSEAHLQPGLIVVEKGAVVEPGAFVGSPSFIGSGAVVRHGAYIRENVAMLDGAVLGHASEAKNALLMTDAKAPHFAYIGDSILGERVNLGAGSRLSNLGVLSATSGGLSQRRSIKVATPDGPIDTKRGKLGAILGDDVQLGCNAVLNPGCLIGPRSIVYANVSLPNGCHRSDTIYKLRQIVETADRY